MIQVPLDPTTISAIAGLNGVQERFDREAQRIAEPARSEAGAQDEQGDGEDGLDPETLLDALVVQPSLYRANARTLRTADELAGTLLDIYA